MFLFTPFSKLLYFFSIEIPATVKGVYIVSYLLFIPFFRFMAGVNSRGDGFFALLFSFIIGIPISIFFAILHWILGFLLSSFFLYGNIVSLIVTLLFITAYIIPKSLNSENNKLEIKDVYYEYLKIVGILIFAISITNYIIITIE